MNHYTSPTQTRTYRLRSRTVARIDSLSAELNLFPSRLIDAMLEQALDDYDAGRLNIGRRAVKYELTSLERVGTP